jgi:sigma-B regulation protein RsbU (phosphoserine phosphatase)
MFNAEHELAKLLQRQQQMLPQSAPQVPGYALKLVYRPAYIATGDYHDFFPCPGGGTAVFLGDGSGHGPCASLLVATMRALLLSHRELHGEPGRSLTRAGRMLHVLMPSDLFMTGLYVRCDEEGRVSWASAGHDPPLRVNRHGRVAQVDRRPVGLPLGIDRDEVYQTVSWNLGPGERLLLFTDGLVEARNPNGLPFGRRRLRAHLSGLTPLCLDDLVPELIARVVAHRGVPDLEDDLSILGIEWQGPERRPAPQAGGQPRRDYQPSHERRQHEKHWEPAPGR